MNNMNDYRIEYAGQVMPDVPLVMQTMERPRFTSKEFKILRSEAEWLAGDIMEGYCRATVFCNGKRVFRYTVILEEPTFTGAANTYIYSAWPFGNYRQMRIVKEAAINGNN